MEMLLSQENKISVAVSKIAINTELRSGEIQILRDTFSLFFECTHIPGNTVFGYLQVLVVEVDIEQINVPGGLVRCETIGFSNLSSDRKRGLL